MVANLLKPKSFSHRWDGEAALDRVMEAMCEFSLRSDEPYDNSAQKSVARAAGRIGCAYGWQPEEIWQYLRGWGMRNEDFLKEELLAGFVEGKERLNG